MRTLFMIALLVCVTSYSMAGEPPERPVTGNPRIDFFTDLQPMATDPLMLQDNPLGLESGEKRSPFLAAALSLAIPGAGQVYNEDYWKAGLFVAAEAASWFIAISNDKKGEDQTALFENYANQHWSAVRYANWTIDNLVALNPNVTKTPDEYMDLIYDPDYDPDECGPPFKCIYWGQLNNLERDVANGVTNGYTHVLPGWGEQQYYELIGKYDQFSRGWDDANLTDVSIPLRSNSQRFYEYSKMRAKANDYYDVASTFVAVAVVNHVLSAIEAYWSASRYNSSLHAEVSMKLQPTAAGLFPMTQARLRYDF